MSQYIIQTRDLTKTYGEQKSVSNLNMHVRKGKIYGLLGRNGAGKTTTMKMLLNLIEPTSGSIRIFNRDIRLEEKKILPRIGSLIESPGFYPNLTGTENLRIFAKLRGIPRTDAIEQALKLVNLPYKDKKLYSQYSLGMKQRLALGVALLGEPEFLILDEPVNGLDPTGIIELRELLKKLVKEREVTILISSHILSELHQLATCYGFLHKGELLKQISAEELNEECKRHICLRTDNIQKTTLLLEQKGNINNYSVYPDNSIRIYECLDNVRMISKLLSSNGVIIDEISVQGENLETYFENLIGGRKNV